MARTLTQSPSTTTTGTARHRIGSDRIVILTVDGKNPRLDLEQDGSPLEVANPYTPPSSGRSWWR
jgi:hypothetical protein